MKPISLSGCRRLFLRLVCLFMVSQAGAQEIVINEYFNTSGQSGEWTELVVVKDNLSLAGWFLGDNNAGTNSWQPKIRFLNIPLWKNLRRGTIIQIDHAAAESDCDDAVVTNKTRGFIRVCSKDPAFFEGGSPSTLFLADGGDFVHIVDTSGKMVHGIGHDDNPGNSVEGGTCFNATDDWKNTSAAVPARRPCGNFTYYRFGMQAPTALRMKAGVLADFRAGMITAPNNPYIDTSDVPAEGTGNGLQNDAWLSELRQPEIAPQEVCAQKSPDGRLSFSWLPAEDAFSADNVTGYIILESSTGTFTYPGQGRIYTEGQILGTGQAQTRVVKILNGSGSVSFSLIPAQEGLRYQVVAFRFGNEPSFLHPTRGRAYNTANPVVVKTTGLPQVAVVNDTLCGPGRAVLRIDLPNLPGGYTIQWFDAPSGGSPLSASGDSLVVTVSSGRSYWAQLSNTSFCDGARLEVKAVIRSLECRYLNTGKVCPGVPVVLAGIAGQEGYTHRFAFGSLPPGTVVSALPESRWSVAVPHYENPLVIRFTVQSQLGECLSAPVTDSLVTEPFNPRLLPAVALVSPGQEIRVGTSTGTFPWWLPPFRPVEVRNGFLTDSTSNTVFSVRALEGDSLYLKATVVRILPGGGNFCKAVCQAAVPFEKPLPALKPVNTLVTADGNTRNPVLDFDRREVRNLTLFNRWGLEIASFSSYANTWPESGQEPGTYFYSAEVREPGENGFRMLSGWVEVVGEGTE
jgi:hypothetical protein